MILCIGTTAHDETCDTYCVIRVDIFWGKIYTKYRDTRRRARVDDGRVASSRARGRAIGLTPRRFSYEIHEGIVRLDRASEKKGNSQRYGARSRRASRVGVGVGVVCG